MMAVAKVCLGQVFCHRFWQMMSWMMGNSEQGILFHAQLGVVVSTYKASFFQTTAIFLKILHWAPGHMWQQYSELG